MTLKFILPKDDTPPEGFADHYMQDAEGRWILQVDGAVPKGQLDEFRSNNVELKKKLEAFGDADPKTVKALIDAKEEIEAEKDKMGDKVNDLVEKRVTKIREETEGKLTGLQEERDKYRKQLADHRIDAALIEAGEAAGLRGSAREDLILRGRQIFSLDETGENIVALDADGNPKYDGVDTLSPKGWVGSLVKEAPHLFDESAGAGSKGGGKGGPGHVGPNPFSKEGWNLTTQGELIRRDRNKAKALAAQAGVTID